MLVDQLLEALVKDMGVDLGGGNVGVPGQFLNRAEGGAVGKEMAGEGMAEHMRRDLGDRNSSPCGDILELAGEDLARQVTGS